MPVDRNWSWFTLPPVTGSHRGFRTSVASPIATFLYTNEESCGIQLKQVDKLQLTEEAMGQGYLLYYLLE